MTPPTATSARRAASPSAAETRSDTPDDAGPDSLADAGRYARSGGEPGEEPAGIGPDPASRRTLIGAVVSGLLGLVVTLVAATVL